jgi:hypothetical protein
MRYDLNDGGMLHSVKCFLEVELKNDGFSLRLMTLMDVFKTPSEAVLDCAGANEPVLVLVYNFQNNFLKMVCQDLCVLLLILLIESGISTYLLL